MTDILRLGDLSLSAVSSIFILLAAFIGAVKIIEEFSKIIGKPVKWIRKQDEETKKVTALEKKQAELEAKLLDNTAKSISHDEKLEHKIEALSDKLADLTDMVVDDRIERMRYEILDMASAISEANRWYSVEQMRHALKVYDEYEEFLVKHHKTNGEIEMSIEVIKKAYKAKYAGMAR